MRRQILPFGKSKLHGCTIVARNYLAQAEVLARSFARYHPGCPFSILIVDQPEKPLRRTDGVEVLSLNDIDLGADDVFRMPMIYDVTELSTAVKPWLLKRLFDGSVKSVMYFDPDIEIFASLYGLGGLVEKHGIVLTPHVTAPIPRDNLRLNESDILGAGIYNLGFLGIGTGCEPFLDWWATRLRRESVIDPARMRFTDQRWVDFVPGLFRHFILRHPSYNVAYWNLHSRRLEWNGRKYTVNGKPLRFFHYSGYNPDQSHLLSKHQGDQPRILLSEHPAVARICREYKKKLVEAGFPQASRERYGFDYLANGLKIGHYVRKTYREALARFEQGLAPEPPNPFGPSGEETFLAWLSEPIRQASPVITRLMISIHESRGDLQSVFRNPLKDDAENFARWFENHGRHELELPNSMVPDNFRRLSVPTAKEESSGSGTPRVRVCGYLRAELGVGEAARSLISGLEAGKISYDTLTYDATSSRQEHPFEERVGNHDADDINIICVNADQTPAFAQKMGPAFCRRRHNVGVWFWEVEDFPSEFHTGFDYVDEVWVASDFTRQAVGKVSPKPVAKIHLPITKPKIDGSLSRQALGLPDGFTFLFSFDFFSVLQRKNPIGLINAFKRAFEKDAGPKLLIKTINGDKRLFDLERLKYAALGRPDIIIRDGYVAPLVKNTLMARCDCYVSLHRSEGFGLTMGEAMALERPVIGTNYSGNLEFMNDGNSYLCNYKLQKVGGGALPYPPGSHWAEPDLDHAVSLMRQVFSNVSEARTRGTRAGADIRKLHSPLVAGTELAGRISQIRARRLRFGPISPIENIEQRVEALEASPRTVLRLSEVETMELSQVEQTVHLVTNLQEGIADQHERLQRIEQTVHLVTNLQERISEQRERLRLTESAQSDIRRGLEERLDAIEKLISKSHQGLSRIALLEHGLQGVAGKLDRISAHLEATPYMSDPSLLRVETGNGEYSIGYKQSPADASTDSYLAFEDIFRGSEDLIRARQRVYLEILHSHEPVLDFGCGRGEMLDLLRDARVAAEGVDFDPAMVAHSRRKGHKVTQMDAVQFLREQADASFGAVFCAQVIEHLPYDQLLLFLRLCRTKVRRDGVLIMETVNPHSHRALKTFWVDLTHQRPIFPEVLVALCRLQGYPEAIARFPCGIGDFHRDMLAEGEYGVIARN